ncbi:hypothetical protein GPX89_32490 [Nocardia sp. ET3-3]|uniref:Uncharacterized protein n=1 Tax=Nocardia terrae TaxID=2675851 RepID=A0A7K1V5N8_9NOCA|nr:hypothetical protein [Nocardia terrae]MVU81944.1 hypothetical protein [Nocardia terrae]
MTTQQVGSPRPSWVDDDCQDGSIHPITHVRAEGILAIHATCEPPCPRAQSARRYLENSGTRT